jgi:hypothetical protein
VSNGGTRSIRQAQFVGRNLEEVISVAQQGIRERPISWGAHAVVKRKEPPTGRKAGRYIEPRVASIWLYTVVPTGLNVCPNIREWRLTMGETNAAIIRNAYEDFSHGNIPAVFAAFDPAISWHVPGNSPLSGDFTGHEQIGGFFERTMQLSAGKFWIDVRNVQAGDDPCRGPGNRSRREERGLRSISGGSRQETAGRKGD